MTSSPLSYTTDSRHGPRSRGRQVTKPTFQGEFQFRRYSDTSTQGQQVVFAVADREALEPFIGMEGKRFMAVLVQIGDDEQPVEPAPKRDQRGPLCREACELCEREDFRRWIAHDDQKIASVADAKLFILQACGVMSRKELDTNTKAQELFKSHVRKPFLEYVRATA